MRGKYAIPAGSTCPKRTWMTVVNDFMDRARSYPSVPPRKQPSSPSWHTDRWKSEAMIRKLSSGGYRLYSRKKNPKTKKRRNLGTFKTRAAAEKHERAVQFFKRR